MVLRIARNEGVLASLAVQLNRTDSFERLPVKVREHLTAARAISTDHERMIRWEVDRIQHALLGLDVPLILLKGAAYVLMELPFAKGRLVSDVDIMVPRKSLSLVEIALMQEGWESLKLDAYDQSYYRKWMHELPPMRHALRYTIVDVHHAILPLTSRLQTDSRRLLQAAQPIGASGLKALAPVDMVLHSATHLFHDGDLDHGLRDLLDLHELLCHFGGNPEFWEQLAHRAEQLQLQRPLFYALHYCAALLHTSVPEQLDRAGAPRAPVRRIMDTLVRLAITPDHPDQPRVLKRIAHLLLYVRAHYNRMPLYLLIPHLLRKTYTRIQTAGRRGWPLSRRKSTG